MTQTYRTTYHVHGLEDLIVKITVIAIIKKTIIRQQGNLQFQCNPYQNINTVFPRARTNSSKMCLERGGVELVEYEDRVCVPSQLGHLLGTRGGSLTPKGMGEIPV